MKSLPENYLTQGDIVEPKKCYLKDEIIFDLGCVIGKTETGFIQIQDIFGNVNYMKITELRKLTQNEVDDLDKE